MATGGQRRNHMGALRIAALLLVGVTVGAWGPVPATTTVTLEGSYGQSEYYEYVYTPGCDGTGTVYEAWSRSDFATGRLSLLRRLSPDVEALDWGEALSIGGGIEFVRDDLHDPQVIDERDDVVAGIVVRPTVQWDRSRGRPLTFGLRVSPPFWFAHGGMLPFGFGSPGMSFYVGMKQRLYLIGGAGFDDLTPMPPLARIGTGLDFSWLRLSMSYGFARRDYWSDGDRLNRRVGLHTLYGDWDFVAPGVVRLGGGGAIDPVEGATGVAWRGWGRLTIMFPPGRPPPPVPPRSQRRTASPGSRSTSAD